MAASNGGIKRSFFDRAAVLGKLNKAEKRVLPKIGRFIRRAAKSSLRLGKMVALADMKSEAREDYEREKKIRKSKGLKPSPRRRQSAKRGQPPKLHEKNSPLKRLIFYAFDDRKHTVVVGPEFFRNGKSGGKAPGNLEYGLNGHSRFPFMGPAMKQEIPKLPGMWRDAVKK